MKIVAETGPPLTDLGREGVHHVGNSTHWIVLEGVSFLTDPWIAEPAHWTLEHRVPPSPLPTKPQVVLVTHKHEDHFDPSALERLDRTATVVAPEGDSLAKRIRALGFSDVRGVKPGDVLEDVRGCTIDVALGKHDCFEVVFRVERRGTSFFFGGDTMPTPEIAALAARKPVTFAILAGERSSLLGKPFVATPEEAVAMAKAFGARRAMLSHHEAYVAHQFPIGWMIRVPEPVRADFPEWFSVPRPGDFFRFE